MKITAITCACHRPYAWSLAEKYMAAQTVKPFQWIVLDDDEPRTVCTMGQQYHHLPQFRGTSSLSKKLDYAIRNNLIGGEAIVFFENDDYYAPTWLEFCDRNLKRYDLIGEGRAIYYNARDRWWYGHENMGHSSLCSTAMNVILLPTLLKCCQSPNPFVDARLWGAVQGRKMVFDPLAYPDKKRLVIGIKGMPGRTGYGGGHVVRDAAAKDDPDMTLLKTLIGKDAKNYENLNMNTPKVPFHTEVGKGHGQNWLNWLGHLIDQPNVVGMELGTFRGESAEFMCENIFTHPTAKYHCVDYFGGSVEHHMAEIDCTTLESDARKCVANFPQANIIKGYSNEVLKEFKTPLDFLYVDAGHDALNVLRDSVYGFDLLKPGGIMIWDDYAWSVLPDILDSPKLAIDTFLQIYSRKLKVIEPRGWQICVKKL